MTNTNSHVLGPHRIRRVLARTLVVAWAVGWIGTGPVSAGGPPCAGDCGGDGTTSIADLIQAVTIALGAAPVARCAAADSDPDGLVVVNELVLAVNAALAGCTVEPGPALVVFEQTNVQPEGIEYDAARGRFIVGSRTEGIIRAVDDDGQVSEIVSDPGLGVSLGLHIDRARDRLLAAGVLAGTTAPALGIYELGSGAPMHVVNLGTVAPRGQHLANDVVSDGEGNAYVTDTLTTALYRVDPDGAASIFASAATLARANGIEIYDDRYLIVATLTGPSLLRVPLDDPQAVTAVDTDIPIGGDGIVFTADGELAIVGSAASAGSVLRLRSDDDWQSASVVGTWDATQVGFGMATTAAARGADVYVIFAHLFDQTREQYEIARAQFAAPSGLPGAR